MKRDFPLFIEGFVIYNQYKLQLFLCKVLHIQKTVVYLPQQTNKITEIMRYLHYVIDQEGNQIETVYSATETPKFSLECLAKIKNGEYKIWDRESK